MTSFSIVISIHSSEDYHAHLTLMVIGKHVLEANKRLAEFGK